MKPTKYLILDYLRQHVGEDNTVNLLSEKLKLSYKKVTDNLQNLEYMKMVTRSPKYLPDSAGYMRKQFIYKARFRI